MKTTIATVWTSICLVAASGAIAQTAQDHKSAGQAEHQHSEPAKPSATPQTSAPATSSAEHQHSAPGGQGAMGEGMMGKGMMGMDPSMMQMMQPTEANPYPHAEMQMHQKMMMAVGPDATETWMRKMIEHHRGAVEMSRLLLTKTSDSAVRRLANDNISKQERDIASLQRWLTRNHKPAQ